MHPETKKHLLYWLTNAGPKLAKFLITLLAIYFKRPQ
jgi:hypothetical protein